MAIEFLGTRRAATRLGLSRARILQFCKDGRLGQLIEGRWLISEDELKQFAKLIRETGRPKSPKSRSDNELQTNLKNSRN